MSTFRKPCTTCGGDCGEFGLQPDMTFRCPACKIKKLGHKPRELKMEEVRKRVLQHVWGVIEFWEKDSRQRSVREKLSGLAFSILAMLDGSAVDVPGFYVVPTSTKSDGKFHKSIGEDWYPTVGKDVEKRLKCDIAGSLHELFHKEDPNRRKV